MARLFELSGFAIVLAALLASGLAMAEDGHFRSRSVIGSGVNSVTGSGIRSATGSGMKNAIVNEHVGESREKFRHERPRGEHHFRGVIIGPVLWPGYFPPLYSAPNVAPGYAMVPPGLAPGFWYFCASANTYYPYIDECAEGWQQIMPPPPPSP